MVDTYNPFCNQEKVTWQLTNKGGGHASNAPLPKSPHGKTFIAIDVWLISSTSHLHELAAAFCNGVFTTNLIYFDLFNHIVTYYNLWKMTLGKFCIAYLNLWLPLMSVFSNTNWPLILWIVQLRISVKRHLNLLLWKVNVTLYNWVFIRHFLSRDSLWQVKSAGINQQNNYRRLSGLKLSLTSEIGNSQVTVFKIMCPHLHIAVIEFLNTSLPVHGFIFPLIH